MVTHPFMKYFTKNLWFYKQLLLPMDKFPTPALVRFLGVHQDEEVWGIWASGGNWSYGQHGWWGNSILKCTQEPSALLYRYHIGNLECFHLIILKISLNERMISTCTIGEGLSEDVFVVLLAYLLSNHLWPTSVIIGIVWLVLYW